MFVVLALVMRRATILLLAAVLVAAAVAPSCLAACCLAQTREARLMAAMPCCAEGASQSMRPQMAQTVAPVATLATVGSVAPIVRVDVVTCAVAAPPVRDIINPPIFLRDAQFRI